MGLGLLLLLPLGPWAGGPSWGTSPTPREGPAPEVPDEAFGRLSPAETHASEILAYLLKIVLGKEGPAAMRKAWSEKGLREPLSLQEVRLALSDKGRDPFTFLVLDANLFHLSQTLFHYDARLSQYGGAFGILGVYPAPEVIAIRLLLLQRLDRGEVVRLGALLGLLRGVTAQGATFPEAAFRGCGLGPEEGRLLMEAIRSRPFLLEYLRSPFVVKALYEMGAVEKEPFTEEARRRAVHARHRDPNHGQEDRVTVAILPSLTTEFMFEKDLPAPTRTGFRETGAFGGLVASLKAAILKRLGEITTRTGSPPLAVPLLQAAAPSFFFGAGAPGVQGVSFCTHLETPMVITPRNAEETIRHVCPQADLAVVILGKHAYLLMEDDRGMEGKGTYPCTFIDSMDLAAGRIEDEVERIGRMILSRVWEEETQTLPGKEGITGPLWGGFRAGAAIP